MFVAGASGKMPEGVRAAIEEVMRSKGGMDNEQSKRAIDAMEARGRYVVEAW